MYPIPKAWTLDQSLCRAQQGTVRWPTRNSSRTNYPPGPGPAAQTSPRYRTLDESCDHQRNSLTTLACSMMKASPSDLDGPVIDATAIRDRLVDADGGGLAGKNVTLYHLDQARQARALGKADARTRSSRPSATCRQRRGKPVPGRRLYVATCSVMALRLTRTEGALYTAECETDVDLPNVWVTEYVKWFRAKKRFSESRAPVGLLRRPGPHHPAPADHLPARGPQRQGVRASSALRRKPVMKAAEAPMPQDENRIHGVFQPGTPPNGLKHAVNAEQFITGESLRNYLLNSMKDFMPEEAKAGQRGIAAARRGCRSGHRVRAEAGPGDPGRRPPDLPAKRGRQGAANLDRQPPTHRGTRGRSRRTDSPPCSGRNLCRRGGGSPAAPGLRGDRGVERRRRDRRDRSGRRPGRPAISRQLHPPGRDRHQGRGRST